MTHDEFNALLGENAVVQAIQEAETRSTGEVRVLVTHSNVSDALNEARRRFLALGMQKTAQRNGVLILVAPKSRAFAIVGDVGIHEYGGDSLWSGVVEEMGEAFRNERWTEGLVQAIQRVGEELARHFPGTGEKNVNELPDAIVVESDRESPPDSP